MAKNQIWANMDKALETQRMSLLELAERSEISYDTIRGWRAKGRFPQLDDAKKLADALELGIDETFFGIEVPEQNGLLERLMEAESKIVAIKEILG